MSIEVSRPSCKYCTCKVYSKVIIIIIQYIYYADVLGLPVHVGVYVHSFSSTLNTYRSVLEYGPVYLLANLLSAFISFLKSARFPAFSISKKS